MPVHQMTVPTPPRSSRSAPGASRPMPSIGAHDGSLSASGASVPERSTCSSMARRSAARSRRRNGRARPRRRRSGHPPLPRPRAGRTGPPRGARASGATASARRRCPRPAVAARYPGDPAGREEDAASGCRQILGDLTAGLPASHDKHGSVGDRVGRAVRGGVELQQAPYEGIGDLKTRGGALKPRGEDHAAGREVAVADADGEAGGIFAARLFTVQTETSIESCSAETNPSARCARPGRCGPPRGRRARRRAERAPSWPPGRHGRPPTAVSTSASRTGILNPTTVRPPIFTCVLRAIRQP